MKLYALSKEVKGSLLGALIAEGPRSVLGPKMQKMRKDTGDKAVIYDDFGNYVSGTL